MIDTKIKHGNTLNSGSRYAADFDYLMHDFCMARFLGELKGRQCLELGCYRGEMTKKLSRVCLSVTAIDIDETCISTSKEACKDFPNISFIQSEFNGFEDYKNYEVIYFSHALEHVPDDLKLISHINHQMNLNQVMITIVPNGTSLSRQIAVEMGLMKFPLEVTEFEKKIGHHRTYDMNALTNLFQSSGMTILESGGIMPKIFSNNQFDRSLQAGIIDLNFLNALNNLSAKYEELCSSIYLVTKKG
jgi:2-polyprenyl-3-methyl-5-hydroxy-6-metoxy-1,4-benzoquinol methylase